MERVTLQVLIASTSNDKLVSHEANARAVERLPNGHMFLMGEEAHHEVLRETDEVRGRVMDAIEASEGAFSEAKEASQRLLLRANCYGQLDGRPPRRSPIRPIRCRTCGPALRSLGLGALR